MAGVELDRCASGHEMSNQQSDWSLPTTSQHHLFCTAWSLLRTNLNPSSSGGYPKVAILTQLPFAVEMWAQMGQITNTPWKNTCGTLPVNFNSGILASGKTRMVSKPSKTTTAWWLPSNSETMPLFIKCQSLYKPGWPWGKLVATYKFAASPLLHYMISTQDQFKPF